MRFQKNTRGLLGVAVLAIQLAVFVAIVAAQNELPPYCGIAPGLMAERSIPAPKDTMTLRQVHTFIRHGDRLPASSGSSTTYATPCWPNDDAVWDCTLNYDEIPDTDPTQNSVAVPRLYRKVYDAGRNVWPGNCLMGQLTQNGYMQQVANGKNLRLAYVEQTPLLSEYLDINEVYIRSDDEPRTVQSAHSLLLGLFPPNDTTNGAQILDVHTMDYQVDDTSVNPNLCPILAQVWNESYYQPSYIQHVQNITIPLTYALAQALNVSIEAVDIGYLFDCVNTHICHGFPIPEGITTDLYNQLVAENVYQFANLLVYPNVTYNSQINVGFYLNDFYNKINGFVNGSGDQNVKFYLWSGHDVTLFAIMVAMDFFDNQWPGYASIINFELYQDSTNQDDWYVRVIHNGNEAILGGCNNQTYCPYTTFASILQSLVPVNPATSCQPTNPATMFEPHFFMKPREAINYAIRKAQQTARKILNL